MTTKEKLIKKLMKLGLFENQAKEIMELAIPELNKIVPEYQITWNSPAEGYLEVFYNIMMVTIKRVALEWLKENKPEAWCIPMFEPIK